MTREEADKIQALIDEYIEYRDRKKTLEPEEGPELDPSLESDDPAVRAAAKQKQLRDRFNRSLLKNPASMMKMRLEPILESLLPEMKVGGGLDLVGVFGTMISALGINVNGQPAVISVVDGHDEVEPDEIGWDEYERLYCIKVPGELMKGAVNYRMNKNMGQMMAEKFGKEEGK